MNCPNCQNLCGEQDTFCFRCGTHLPEAKPPNRGTHWIPLLILTLLSVTGICLFFLMPMNSVPSEEVPAETADTPWFSVEYGFLHFDASKYTGGSELTVPEFVDGQAVVALSSRCFAGCDTLTTVILPDSLIIIGDEAFEGCTALRGIFIPEGVNAIGVNAFSGCASLEAISIPGTVTYIGEGCFSQCKKLLHIFYDGRFAGWKTLYRESITQRTHVYCEDGDFLNR